MYLGDEEDDEDDLDGPTGKRAAEGDDDDEVRKNIKGACFYLQREPQPTKMMISKPEPPMTEIKFHQRLRVKK